VGSFHIEINFHGAWAPPANDEKIQMEFQLSAEVHKGLLFNYLTIVSVMLERSEASQSGGIFTISPF
jgi:hypothetical protein